MIDPDAYSKFFVILRPDGTVQQTSAFNFEGRKPPKHEVEITREQFTEIDTNPDMEHAIEDGTLVSRARIIAYPEQRRREYPALEEQVGALMKAVDALSSGTPIPLDAQVVIDDIRTVKARNPKR